MRVRSKTHGMILIKAMIQGGKVDLHEVKSLVEGIMDLGAEEFKTKLHIANIQETMRKIP